MEGADVTRRLAVIGALTTAFFALVASSASAASNNSYLCYSKNQVDPNFWVISTSNTGNTDATTLLAAGYWLPYAEKSVPTSTQLPGGWYLICNLQTGETAVPGGIIGGAGETITDPTLAGMPGYYPQAT
jgi:hypothetical protein